MGAQWQGWCSLLFLLISCYQWRCSHAQPDVYLELRSTNLTNNTVVLISDIGDTDYPLICNTNLNPCCAHIDNRLGEWYYPNGSALHIKGGGSSIYRTRRDAGSGVPGGALLHRRHNVMGPAGIYRCTIPDANSMDQTLYVGLYTSATNGAQLDSINFELTSGAAVMVTYSLTCVSNGGPISTMQWEKDDVTINNASIYPSLTDAAMSTYTNTLQETGREPGVYTCIATDGGTLSLSQSLMVAAANPPTAVMASLDATSGNVLISLTQPVGGATVTGYRIYYSVGGSQTSELFTTAENEFMLDLKGASSLDDMMISIRAESAQLPSELVLVNVTAPVVESTTAMEVPSATTTGPPSPSIAVDVTANLSTPLMVGQTGYTLTCDVSGADNLNATITYEWTTNGETVSDVSSNTLDLSPLMLSDAGDYTCNVTVGSALLTSDIQASANNTQTVTVDIPDPQSVTVTSSDNVISSGSSITVTCTVELDSAILDSELSLLMVDAQLSRDGTPLTLANSTVTGTTFNFTTTVSSFSESDVGNYTCTATIRPQPSSQYLTGMGQRQSSSFEITIAVVTVEPTIATETTTGQPIESITDISITSSGTNTAGESYSLECSVTVTGSTDQPTVTWMDNGTEISSTTDRMVSGISSSAGSYSTTLTFSPLRASDVGIFKCIATLGNVTNSQIFNVAVQVPNPSVTISSNPSSPIIAGSSVTVICTVELNQYVDVGLTVNVTWTGPAGVAISPTDPLMENTTRYTSAVMFSSFGRQQSGEYTCSATISSDTLMTSGIKVSGMENITVGVYLSLKGVVYANNSVIPITEIGETNSTSNTGLQCITDRRPCCLSTPNRLGHWQFPNKTTVGISGTSTSFYRNRRDDGTVNLNRVDVSVMMPTGQFCCIVRDATDVDQTVCANIVSYTIVITPNGTLTVGQTYSLDCSLTGTADTVTYQWFDNNGTQLTDVSQLEFSLLRASDVGLYTCRATVGGVVVMETTTVTISLPAPTAVTVTPPVGVIIAGSSPILTCTVELSPAVDVPVNVSTEWSSPDMTMVTTTSSMMESLTRYTIMANVDAARNGSYTCRASIDSSSQFITGSGMTSGPITVTVASLPAPTALMVSSPTSTSISLTWEQPLGASAVDTYEIIYDRIVNECGGDIGSYPTVTVIVDNGSLRSYTLTNSSSTPVEEDSRYFITLRAVNSVTRSEAKMAFPNPITTRDAAPGLVQSLRVGSVDVTNITIQWDRVNCVDRNGGIDSYFVSFYPTSNPNEDDAQTILGTGDSDRMLSITALPPLTSYTFEVEANNPRIRDPGAIATITVSTTVPQDLEFLLSGQLYPNNSLVTLGSDSVLYCLTPSTECCGSSVSGEWYLPDGTAVSSSTAPFSRSQVPSAVSLRRGSSTPPSGVFRCEIPDASGTGQNIYVGIYPQGDGSPSIQSVMFDRNSTTLTCTSTGGPPTTVTWRKNNVPVNLSLYEQSQRLMFTENSTYENILFNADVANFVGSFTCEVSNARGTNEVTVELNGITIDRDPFIVGQSATASCVSDAPATRIEWLNGEDVLMTSSMSTQRLDLVFSLVTDSIHRQVYICRVNRSEDGMVATQNFSANVVVPPAALTATVSSSDTAIAGMIYSLTCTVSKTVNGLINSPTATWTTGGVAVTNGNGITVSNTTFNETAASTLTFDVLRTSHDGRYSCDGTLASPALETELMRFTEEILFVQISTPDVVITVPSGPLFAGSIAPLILTCTISIDIATDTDVDMDVTWLRGSTSLSNSDARVTLSSVSGFRPSFTSTLTLNPLSIADNTTFTCQAIARRPNNQLGFISNSEMGVSTNTVIVNLPSAPVLRINPFNGVALAGASLRVNCSLILQDGIIYNNTLTTTWTRGDMPLPSGESLSGLISLSPVLTSHAGRYTCTARLNIPEAGVDVSGTNTTSIVVQIPTPTLTISGSPRDVDFFRGLILTFTCMIEIDPAVDTGVTVEASWERNGTQLEDSSEGRITVLNTGLGSVPYQTKVKFNSADFEDAGIYNCSARIIPQMPEFILEATGFITRNITVLNFPPQLVNITDEGVSIAGYTGYTLVCTTNREADLNAASTLVVQWLDSDGNMIISGDNISISGTQGPSNDVSITSRLTFNSLMTSQAGLYTCRTFLTIPDTVDDHTVEYNFTVTVKLPAPEVVAISESRGAPIYEGTVFSLSCLITPNMTGVNTDITIQRNFTGPGTSAANRVTREDTALKTTLMFRPVAMTDDGRHVCSAVAISTSQYPNVEASDATVNDAMITISILPPPVVTITAPPTPTGGQSYTLNCSARTKKYVINVPRVEWVNVDSTDRSITQPPQTNDTVSANRSLTFNHIRTSHGGHYTCQASVDIPLANIADRANNSSEDIRVQIPTSVVLVNEGPSPAYNGTVYNLTGVLQLNTSIVDTDVTVIWMWSLNGQVLVRWSTSAAPYRIIIPFNPLATVSSGLYDLNLNIVPRNPQYVEGNNDSSTTYNLTVLSLPAPVPSIEITARSVADDRCSEAMTFTCTATTVDNLYTPPTIQWRYEGSAVPDSGNPLMNSTTGQLIFSNIMNENSGDYTCRAIITIPESGIDDHYGETSTTVSTDMPAKVQNLMCSGNPADMSLTITWGEPVAQGTGVVGYSVECQRVNQLQSRELVSVPLTPAYDEGVEETQTQVTQGLDMAIPYNVTVKALNLAGCGEEEQIFCFTQEGVPPMPKDVIVTRISDTAMMVSWHKFTLVELKGFATYVITYTVSGGSRKRQNNQMVTAMWFENNKTIDGLPPRMAVDVEVRTTSSGGRSDAAVRTLEAVPTESSVGIIIGAIIAVILAIVVIVITIIIIIILVRRHRVSKKYSPSRDMYNVSTKSEERELRPIDNGDSHPALSDKEKEALEESAMVPPPTEPRSAITTEVLDRMKPVSQTSFRDHVAGKHEDRDKGFESEYQSFGTDPVNSHEIAKLPINRPKNRFANIFPYDHSRVTLNNLPGEEGSDYINACSLDGYKRKGCYIAAQGPMPNTISDFWRMVWEKRLPNIVMLTKCLEAGRRKCEQYWADNIGEDYQTPDKKLNITTTSVMPYADFVIRTFNVKSLTDASLDPLSVTQYHFTSWPDHGVPKFATSLISFIRRVQRGHTKDSGRQLLVHCSAGVGRTGTFITLDSMLDRMAAKEPDVNVYEFVYKMRQRRVLMVQTMAQYVFIHDALNELITCGQTDIVASALRTKVNFLSKIIPAKGITGFQNQFQLLEQVSRLPADEDLTDAMETYNQCKNRYPDKIPYNMSRARLRPTGEDGSEYINASFIDGYKQRNAYIATQGPLQNTVNDIWRMLYEFKSRTLVMLCNMNEDSGEASYPFFPSKEEEAVKYGKMVVTLQSKASYTDFIVRKFSIQEDKQGSPKNDGFVVTQFHLTEWPPNQVPNTGTLIEMLDMITKNQMSTGNRPITVMCNDGVGRTGTFICIHAQLERLKTEGVVDFFQSIKSARIQRAGLVPDVDQYAFCHTVLADYIDKFDNYANFKDMII